MKKYLVSRLDEPIPESMTSGKGLAKSEGTSGIIGGTGDGASAHDIHQSKSLDYRFVLIN